MRSAILCVLFSSMLSAQQGNQEQEQLFKFESASNLVVLNVSVKGKDGRPVEDLKADDFSLFEDNKRVKVSIFDYQRLSREAAPAEAKSPAAPQPSSAQESYKDRRLIVLYFDFSNMSPGEQMRAGNAGRSFIDRMMTPADLVAIATYSAQLRLVQDFTGDRTRLARVIAGFQATGGSDVVTEQEQAGLKPADNGAIPNPADEEDFQAFSADRKLNALEQMAKQLGRFRERKALVYISSGIDRTGVENESQLRRTINTAVRANVAFYPIDARGLSASPPVGDAGGASGAGVGLFSGDIGNQAAQKLVGQRDALTALAADTGGRIQPPSNDLSLGIQRAQRDVDSYYILGYYSPNAAADGKFRKFRVELSSQPRAKLEYRPGYFAAKTFRQFDEVEKESQLEEALALETPMTEIPIAVEFNYFRFAKNSYFVPVAIKIPGSAITLLKKRGSEEAAFDFIGAVKNAKGSTVGTVRDTIRVRLGSGGAGLLPSRSLQYDTAFTLAPGEYSFKLLVRENQEGKMGTFLARYVVPDLSTENTGVRLSSVVWSGQREKLEAAVGTAGESRRRQETNPLVKEGQKVVPSVSRVFNASQNLYVYFEVYDTGGAPGVAANLSIFRGKQLVFVSQEVRLNQPVRDRLQTIPFQIQLPLADFAPGRYTAQVNVVDEAGRKFGFSRSSLVMTR